MYISAVASNLFGSPDYITLPVQHSSSDFVSKIHKYTSVLHSSYLNALLTADMALCPENPCITVG